MQESKIYHNFKYETAKRFNSYYLQIRETLSLNPKRVLCIGKGTGVFDNYIMKQGIKIDTLDIDETLKPNLLIDLTDYKAIKNVYDLVVCFETLEHIAYWSVVHNILEELSKTCKYVIISVPQVGFAFDVAFSFPLIKKLFRREFIGFNIRIPLFYKNKNTPAHKWELGNGVGIRRFRLDLQIHFDIKKEFVPLLNSYHRFYVLQSKVFK